MANDQRHPDAKTLKAFAIGKLDEREMLVVGRHVSQCEQCAQALDTPVHERLVDQLRNISYESSVDKKETPPEASPPRSAQDLAALFAKHSNYRLEKQLGSGGMGAVYLATHKKMGRSVAIKVIRGDLVADKQAIARFHQEVQSAARLSHRNVVTAYDADQVDDIHFLAMEYIEGESLAQTIDRKGALGVTHSCNYILQAALGIQHAFEQGMVHRDIKPANLMKSTKGVIKVMDFGLARVNDGKHQSELTASGVVMGTASFIAPEQARDSRLADVRSDLYSLGCTLYYLLAAQPPFVRDGYVETVIAHCTDPFPSIQQQRHDVPDEVARIISKLTAKDPDARYQTPSELMADLAPFAKPTKSNTTETIADAQPVSTPISIVTHDTATPQSTSRPNRRAAMFGIAGVLAASLLAAGYFVVGGAGQGSHDSQGERRAGENRIHPGSDVAPNSTKVLLVISADRFWYSDLGPIRAHLQQSGVPFTITADRVGIANFNPDDRAPDRTTVNVQRDIIDIVENDLDDYTAVVFMGDGYDSFIATDAVGAAVNRLLQSFRARKWIAAIGKGMNIPIYHGAFDGATIADSRWIEVSNASQHRTTSEPVVVDNNAKVITGSSWNDVDAFSDALITNLR
ncbi:protein kinase domain-containing protein [Stieleria varia]|uniref:Serine/threonine-protein kinase PknB n=1 Tax=Stieleria varia TaxID=2528005 RepID=A0A5C6AEC5_9BACT|nr:protein kinase [Stieleria varia]TWT98324.1 Serine/threonine-protein kinase PknB [Stieleria varia]